MLEQDGKIMVVVIILLVIFIIIGFALILFDSRLKKAEKKLKELEDKTPKT